MPHFSLCKTGLFTNILFANIRIKKWCAFVSAPFLSILCIIASGTHLPVQSAERNIDAQTNRRPNCAQHCTLATCSRLGIVLLVLALGTAADHAIPHLLENRQRCEHRKREQQNALYRLHINGSG